MQTGALVGLGGSFLKFFLGSGGVAFSGVSGFALPLPFGMLTGCEGAIACKYRWGYRTHQWLQRYG